MECQWGHNVVSLCRVWEATLFSPFLFPTQRIPLSDMTRTEINDLLVELGFYKKSRSEDEVPEEFRFSPAKDSPFKEHRSTTAPTNTEPTGKPGPGGDQPHSEL